MINKKIILLLALLVSVIVLSGCNVNIDDVIDGFSTDLKERVSINQQEVDKLYKAGLLSEEAAKELKEGIQKSGDRITTKNWKAAEISKVAYEVRGQGGSNTIKFEDGSTITANNKDREEFLSILSEDDDAIKQLMNNLDLNIYVLKKTELDGDAENSIRTFDTIYNIVNMAKGAKTAKNLDAAEAALNSYFVDSGKKVWDMNDPKNHIIKNTDVNEKFSSTKTSSNVMGKDYVGVKVTTNDDGTEEVDYKLSIVVREFNPDAVERLLRADGASEDLYLIIRNKCYLMRYPVQYVKGYSFEENQYKADYEESKMEVNILTGKIYDSNGDECSDTAGRLLLTNGSGRQGDMGESSFIVDGGIGPQTKYGYLDEQYINDEGVATPPNADQYGRIVLRDYLELSYMPDVVSGENFVALGRRVRLTKFRGNQNEEEIGIFLNKDGKQMENSSSIKNTDLMSTDVGSSKIKLDIQTYSDGSSDIEGDSGDTTGVSSEGELKRKQLPITYTSAIETTSIFPGGGGLGGILALSDDLTLSTLESGTGTVTEPAEGEEVSTSTGTYVKPFMYGMALDIDPFKSNLYSGWIEVTGETGNGSLDWWNNWLAKFTYRYRIDRDKLLNYLVGSYTYEMRENGFIVLDIPTIVGIQKLYEHEDRVASASWFSTMFVILGMILLGYGTLVTVAWIYDTNIVTGPRLLGLVSFNRWEAITSTEEMPYVDSKNRKYMTFHTVAKASAIIMAMGLTLILVDILSIIDMLIATAGLFAQKLGDVLQGIL